MFRMNTTLAEAIRQFRAEKHVSQRAFACAVGMSQAQVGHLERGDVLPSVPTLAKIARLFHFSPGQIGLMVLSSFGTEKHQGQRSDLRRA